MSVFIEQRKSLAAFLAHKLLQPQDVDDILQDLASVALEQGERADIRSPASYLFIVARNLVASHLKAQAQAMAREIDDSSLMSIPSEAPSVETQVESLVNFEAILESVDSLPRQCRRVFLLRKLLGWSHKQIASHLNISPSTVERHITNALTRLDGTRQAQLGDANTLSSLAKVK